MKFNNYINSNSFHTPKNSQKRPCLKLNKEVCTASMTTMDTIDSPHCSSQVAPFNNLFQGNNYQSNQSLSDLNLSPQLAKRVLSSSSQGTSMRAYEKKIRNIFNYGSLETESSQKGEPINLIKGDSFEFQQHNLTQASFFKKESNQSLFEQIKEQNEDQSNCDDDEEEFCIWDNEKIEKMGVDSDLFIDRRGEELSFYQLYRLRSFAYQPSYVSRMDTINEVKVISSHYEQEIPTNELKKQQHYLDKYLPQQSKDTAKMDTTLKMLSSETPKNLSDRQCQTERAKKYSSTHLEKGMNNSKLKDNNFTNEFYQVNNKINNQTQSKQMNNKLKLKLDQIYQPLQQQQQQLQQKQQQQQQQPKQSIKNLKNVKSIQNTLQNQSIKPQYINRKRQKISICQDQAQKLLESKRVPIRKITLHENNNSKTDLSLLDEFPSPVLTFKQSSEPKYLPSSFFDNLQKDMSLIRNKSYSNTDKITINSFKANNGISVTQASKSVIQYLKEIVQEKRQAQTQRERSQNFYSGLNLNLTTTYKKQEEKNLNNHIYNLPEENIKRVKINLNGPEKKTDKNNLFLPTNVLKDQSKNNLYFSTLSPKNTKLSHYMNFKSFE